MANGTPSETLGVLNSILISFNFLPIPLHFQVIPKAPFDDIVGLVVLESR